MFDGAKYNYHVIAVSIAIAYAFLLLTHQSACITAKYFKNSHEKRSKRKFLSALFYGCASYFHVR